MSWTCKASTLSVTGIQSQLSFWGLQRVLGQETIGLMETDDVAQKVSSLGRGNDQKGERGRKQEHIMGMNMKSTQFIFWKTSKWNLSFCTMNIY